MEIKKLEDRVRDLEVKIKWNECIHGTALKVRAMKAQVREYKAQIENIKNEHIRKEKELEAEIQQDMDKLKGLVSQYEKIQ